jgi:hypothetical protein
VILLPNPSDGRREMGRELAHLNLAGLKPVYDFVDLQYTAEVKQIKDSYWVVFNRARGMLLVMDRDVQNQPYVVMRVQETNGQPRPWDKRVLDDLRKMNYRLVSSRNEHHYALDLERDLLAMETERESFWAHEQDELAYGLADTIKWVGKDVVPSFAWKARSVSYEERVKNREAIRALSQ